MTVFSPRSFPHAVILGLTLAGGLAARAQADEIWVAPSYQQDTGGLGIGSNGVWPVSAAGVVRFAWAVPNDLQTFQSAKVVLIPHAPAGPADLEVYVCRAEHADLVGAACTGPFPHAFTGVANQLAEVDVSAAIAPQVGAAGLNHLAVVAWSNPTTASDHIVGMRFAYAPVLPSGVATLGTNVFSGTQTAPGFVGDGSGLTNLPFPVGAATLGPNIFSGVQIAPAFIGNGAGLTSVAKLGANTFTGSQTIMGGTLGVYGGSLDLGAETHVTKGGALFLHTIGQRSTYLGIYAGASSVPSAGGDNTAVGNEALSFNVAGTYQTAVGSHALASSTSGSNTAVGAFALRQSTTGGGNTAVGATALTQLAAGSDFNIAIGAGAGSFLTSGDNNLYLASSGAPSESDTIRIGAFATRTFVQGIRGVTTGQNNAVAVLVDSQGQLGTVSSSRRFKEDIHDMADASQRLLQLRPVTFRYTHAYTDGSKPIQYGLVAEEVAEVFPEVVAYGADGQAETVQYHTLNVLLLNELQKQQHDLHEQQRRIEALERQVASLVGKR